ncbi:uncharacterized protein LOC121369622 [Gigantopelta aegis]|uniref:uncharacterized protein LOC121369622 n=1 Tax=Gigantopelta aegis TaxID=1735272 RepID=UPI001B88D9BD|nr:uncharacterized protein LOC121369622 [Gigantopelta aegis]XP_041350583.1 uncharacterized protein LOC121369622 [Gigantopelta aegis]
MSYIHRLNNGHEVKPQSIVSSHIGDGDVIDSVPAVFQHDGLVLTPSVWGHSDKKGSPDYTEGNTIFHPSSECSEGHSFTPIQQIRDQTNIDSGSPAVPVFLRAGAKPISKLQKPSQIATVINERSSSSPMAPMFMTPGAKQINKTPKASQVEKVMVESIAYSPAAPQFVAPGAKQINKALKASEEVTVQADRIIQSPCIPTFVTPGAKQIWKSTLDDVTSQRSHMSDGDGGDSKRPVRRKVNTELFKDDAPEPPEFTMSLQDLTELTQSFNMKSGSSDCRPLTGSVECSVTCTTPVMPQMLSDQLEKLGMMPMGNVMPKCPNSAFRPLNSRIPRPPKLMGNYGFSYDQDENFPPV